MTKQPTGLPDQDEFVKRSMDRLMATAKYGKQPNRPTKQTVVTVKAANSGKDVSVAFTLADIEAVLTEMDLGTPCGICHHNPCSWSMPAETLT